MKNESDYYGWLRSEANELVRNKARLEKVILIQMNLLLQLGIDPTWDHFKMTGGWERIQEYLNKEDQFHYRNHWFRIYRQMAEDR